MIRVPREASSIRKTVKHSFPIEYLRYRGLKKNATGTGIWENNKTLLLSAFLCHFFFFYC